MEGNHGCLYSFRAPLCAEPFSTYQTDSGNSKREACQAAMVCLSARLNTFREQRRVVYIHAVVIAALQMRKAALSDSILLTVRQRSGLIVYSCDAISGCTICRYVPDSLMALKHGRLCSSARQLIPMKACPRWQGMPSISRGLR